MHKCSTRIRLFAVLASLVCSHLSAQPAPLITVGQLREFLTSPTTARESDAEIARKLGSVALGEQLTRSTLAGISAQARLGPEAALQLRLLAASSSFTAPPANEQLALPALDQLAQERLLQSARDYVGSVLHALPDFLATRMTDSFDNSPQRSASKNSKPFIQLHFIGEHHREIAYRNGQEVDTVSEQLSKQYANYDTSSLTTWGEFGPILTMILTDAFKGHVVWNRWQMSDSGQPVAVFGYAIPESASNYLIDLRLYTSENRLGAQQFRQKPAYHGEIYLDPQTGAIDRITLEAELAPSSPVTYSGIALQYGRIAIGGTYYTCPIRGTAVSELLDTNSDESSAAVGSKYINEVRFLDYHKFSSSARIIPSDAQTSDQPQPR